MTLPRHPNTSKASDQTGQEFRLVGTRHCLTQNNYCTDTEALTEQSTALRLLGEWTLMSDCRIADHLVLHLARNCPLGLAGTG